MAPLAKGPFFLGGDFCMADLVLAPWWQRMCTVLRAYRKFDPSAFSRLQVWFEACAFCRSLVKALYSLPEPHVCRDLVTDVQPSSPKAPGGRCYAPHLTQQAPAYGQAQLRHESSNGTGSGFLWLLLGAVALTRRP
eukprot:g33556.t1